MTDKDRSELATLLKEAEMSGGQGRGLYGTKQGVFKTMKGIKKSKKILLEAFENNKSIVYHTRFATQGKIKLENNHPFTVYGKKHNLVGVHNGHLYSEYYQTTREIEENGGRPDSYGFFKYLADNGLEKTFDRYYMRGWGAFVWYDLDVKKWYAFKFDADLEAIATDFGLVVATRRLWDKFYSGRDIKLNDLTLYELNNDGVTTIEVYERIRYVSNTIEDDKDPNFKIDEIEEEPLDKTEEWERNYGYWDYNGKWHWDYGGKQRRLSYQAGKKIKRRLEREAMDYKIPIKESKELKSDFIKKGEEQMKKSGLTFFSVGGKIFEKDNKTGEIRQEVIDDKGDVYLLPI